MKPLGKAGPSTDAKELNERIDQYQIQEKKYDKQVRELKSIVNALNEQLEESQRSNLQTVHRMSSMSQGRANDAQQQ